MSAKTASSVSRIDPRIDLCIERAAPFARPILTRLRSLIHRACPEVTETLKWNSPSFEHHGLLCGFAAFKKHCAFGFWKEVLLRKNASATDIKALDALGRIESEDDLPSDAAIVRLIRRAAKLNEDGVKAPAKPKAKKPPPRTPTDLAAALRQHPEAAAQFRDFSPSHKREYIEWITEAKRPETRARRLATAVEWIAQGKGQNWKYERKG